jgi:hypothetical protein
MQQVRSSTSHASKQTLTPKKKGSLFPIPYALPMPRRQKYGRSYDVSLVQRTYLGKVRQ